MKSLFKIVLMVSMVLCYQIAFARGIDDRIPSYDLNDHLSKEYVPKVVGLEGRIRCSNSSHSSHENDSLCNIEFIKENGKIFDVDSNSELKKEHCKKHKDLLVKVNAIEKGGFLFWGGGLDVKSFKVLKELPRLRKEVENPKDKFRRLQPISIDVRY